MRDLFGEQRPFTNEELQHYKQVTAEQSKPLGVNIFDLMREFAEDRTKQDVKEGLNEGQHS